MLRKVFFLLLTFASCCIEAAILENDSLSFVLPFAEKDTLIIFDIDNTLIESSIQMGSAQWRGYIRAKARAAGFDVQESEEILDRFWYFAQSFVPVRLVDAATLSTLDEVRSKTLAIALTAREPLESECTIKQLHSVGIDLKNDAFAEGVIDLLPFPCSYQNGVIFSGNNKKGAALIAFLHQMNYSPKRIVFIDDRLEQVCDLEKFLNDFDYIGIHFCGAEERVKAFNPCIADLQWSCLPQIISDQEASVRLGNRH